MNTNSQATSRHPAYQETQWLPVLTLEMMNRKDAAKAAFAARPNSESAPEWTHRHLPFKKTQLLPVLTPDILAGQDGAGQSPARGSTTEGVGRVSATMIELAAKRAFLNAWGVPLLG